MTNCSKANGKTHLSVLSQLREERRKKSQHDTLRCRGSVSWGYACDSFNSTECGVVSAFRDWMFFAYVFVVLATFVTAKI